MAQSNMKAWNKRFSVSLSLLLGWVFYYLCQRCLPLAMTVRLLHEKGLEETPDSNATTVDSFNKGDLGVLQSCFAIAYATSVFINGFLSDRFSSRFLFCFGLAMSSSLCLLFPLTEGNITLGCVVWFVFGLFQGCGWPSSAKLLHQWYTPEELGTWWSIVSCSGNLACSVILYLFLGGIENWRNFFFIIGMTALIFSIPISYTVQSPPKHANVLQKVTLTSNGVSKNGSSRSEREDSKSKPSNIPWYGAFFVVNLWIVALLYILWWLGEASVMDWGQVYLEEVARLPTRRAADTVSIMEVGCTIGKISAGPLAVWVIRQNIKKNGVSSNTSIKFSLIFFMSIILTVLFYSFGTYTSVNSNELVLMMLFASIGALVEAVCILASLSAIEIVPEELSGSALGLIVATGQIFGRSAAGWPFSVMVEAVGWNRAYQLIGTLYIATIALSGYLMVTFNNSSHHKHNKQH